MGTLVAESGGGPLLEVQEDGQGHYHHSYNIFETKVPPR